MGNQVSEGKSKKNKKVKYKQDVSEQNLNDVQKTIFYENIIGKKKKTELTNQDTWEILNTELGETVKYFAIYDGHGAKGKEASSLFKSEVRKSLISDKTKIQLFTKKTEVEKYFRDLFKSIQKKFCKKSADFELSGSCAICVLVVDLKFFVINLGDSRCVLGVKKSNKDIGIEMSIDHKPNREDEAKRIVERGGEVSEKGSGIPRVLRKNDELPGLAVSRSVGDIIAHEVGVSYEPEVIEKELETEDYFIVIGSDGIWDAMSSAEVVGFLFEKMKIRPDVAVKLLAEEARNRWEVLNLYKQKYLYEIYQSKNQGNQKEIKEKEAISNIDIDDITVIVYFLPQD